MIPKILHYCWFGNNAYSNDILECMASWNKYCPDYKIIKWDENNFDINSCSYVKEAYEAKRWAFVSDYVRVWALYNYGGVYVDTDVELLKKIDDLLENEAFAGFEHGMGVNTGLILGANKNNTILKEHLTIYENSCFIQENGKENLKSCVEYTTDILKKHGLKKKNIIQKLDAITIYPIEYFCPRNPYTGKEIITDNTYSVHRYIGSWADETTKYGQQLKKISIEKYGNLFGKVVFILSYSYYVLKKKGFVTLIKKTVNKIKILLFKSK